MKRILLAFALATVCTAANGQTARWDRMAQGANWTGYTLEAIGQHGWQLLQSQPADVANYCPRYATASAEDRARFWMGLLSALARYESNYNPNETYTENFRDREGRLVVSRGLLQISMESANSTRYNCGITNAQQLHDPKTNLTCGVRILNHLVTQDGVIATSVSPWRGASAYWSPFRKPDRRSDIANWTARQAYCRQDR